LNIYTRGFLYFFKIVNYTRGMPTGLMRCYVNIDLVKIDQNDQICNVAKS